MKHTKKLGTLLLSGLLLAGCSQSAPVSKEVSRSCTLDQDGMKMTLVMHAPSEDSDIDKMTFKFVIPTSLFTDAFEGLELTEDQIKENLKQGEDMMKTTIASQLGVTEDDVQVESTDDAINMSIDLNDFAKVAEQMGVDVDEGDLVFKDVVSQMEKEEDLACE